MNALRSIKNQIIIIQIAFSLVIAIMITSLAVYYTHTMERSKTIQATKFNLQLIANIIRTDVTNLTSFGDWCSSNKQMVEYISNPSPDAPSSIAAFKRLHEEFRNTQSHQYIARVLVISRDGKNILQLGNTVSDYYPLTGYPIEEILPFIDGPLPKWSQFADDPLKFDGDKTVIPYLAPIIEPFSGETAGYVFLAVKYSIITDKLDEYTTDNGSDIYLTLDQNSYLIQRHELNRGSSRPYSFRPFVPAQTFPALYDANRRTSTDLPARITIQESNRWIAVESQVTPLISIAQVIPPANYRIWKNHWLPFALISVFILFCALLVTLLLNHRINRPIILIRKRLLAIGAGDFSIDTKIEGENEIGEIGKGINQLTKDIRLLIETKLADEKKKKDLEYRMLQSQINPHFLYNTLASIKWMAKIQRSQGIVEMCQALSSLMKCAAKDTRTLVLLADEIKIINDYILIQHYRYGGTVELSLEIDSDDLLSTMIPRFSLQPLVENAIFHGIEPKGGGKIILRVQKDNDHAVISIIDNGVGMSADLVAALSSGSERPQSMFQELGVQSVNLRIKYAFGEKYGIHITSKENEYTNLAIHLPLANEVLK